MASTINASTSSGIVQTADTSGVLQLQTASTTAVTIDTSQNVGVGVTPSAWSQGRVAEIGAVGNGVWAYSGITRLMENVYFNSGYKYAASGVAAAYMSVDNGSFDWNTTGTITGTAGATATFTHAMTLDASGNLLVGTTTAIDVTSGTADGQTLYNGGRTDISRSAAPTLNLRRRTSDGSIVQFFRDTTSVGTISVTTSATSYNTSSDYRLKNTIAPMTGALAKVAQLKPVTYKWNVDGSDGEGFIAHELAEVCPHAVNGEKDAVDADGKPVYQGIDVSFLVATLTASIQELSAQVTELKAEVQALKGA